jgi:hypothetical protein
MLTEGVVLSFSEACWLLLATVGRADWHGSTP